MCLTRPASNPALPSGKPNPISVYIPLLQVSGSHGQEYKAVGKDDVFALATDLALVWDAEYKLIVQEYSADNDVFLEEFGHAWMKFVNADRFDGPTGNVCNDHY